MSTKNGFLILIATVSLGFVTNDLSAHQQKEAVTRIIFNPRTENIEVIHRFLIHDAEHATKILFGKNTDIIDDKKSQQQFASYVIQQFSIRVLSGEQLALTTVGFEVEGKHIWIYQEALIPRESPLPKRPLELPAKTVIPAGLSITHSALREIWSEQVNLVNVEYNKKVRSLVFAGSLNSQSVSLYP